ISTPWMTSTAPNALRTSQMATGANVSSCQSGLFWAAPAEWRVIMSHVRRAARVLLWVQSHVLSAQSQGGAHPCPHDAGPRELFSIGDGRVRFERTVSGVAQCQRPTTSV